MSDGFLPLSPLFFFFFFFFFLLGSRLCSTLMNESNTDADDPSRCLQVC